MFERAKYKEDAKRMMNSNRNRSGMIGAQFFHSFVSTGIKNVIVAAFGAVSAALGSFTILGALSSLGSSILTGMLTGNMRGVFGSSVKLIVVGILVALLSPLLQVVLDAADAPVDIGLNRYYLYVRKNGIRPRVLSILEGLDYFWDIVLLTIAEWFYVVRWPWLLSAAGGLVGGIMIVVGVVTSSGTGIFLGIMLFILVAIAATVWTIYMQLTMWPFFMVIADHPQLKAQQAIERCKKMTEGHILDLFVFRLSFIGWDILSWLTCGIVGLVYSGPYYNTARANVYAALKGSPIALDQIGDLLDDNGITRPQRPTNDVLQQLPQQPALFGTVGNYKGYTFPLEPDESVVIGRDAAVASIVLTTNTEKISRRHCTVRYDSRTNKYEVVDFSMNGVYVGTTRIESNKPVYLPRGTEIFLGSQANGFKLV